MTNEQFEQILTMVKSDNIDDVYLAGEMLQHGLYLDSIEEDCRIPKKFLPIIKIIWGRVHYNQKQCYYDKYSGKVKFLKKFVNGELTIMYKYVEPKSN